MNQARRMLRDPSEDTYDLYPGLSVYEDRVGGSINVQRSRLPLWAIIGTVIEDGWEQAEDDFSLEGLGWTKQDLSNFLYCLVQARGELGRLLLILADLNRVADASGSHPYWWEDAEHRRRVREQLQRCLDALAD